MTQWWTYGLSDFLMFSARSWWRLLALHNQAWLPLHLLTTLGAGVLLVAVRGTVPPWLARAAWAVAGLAWLLAGWAFHWLRYAQINWAASYFAVGFAVQGLLLIGMALAGGRQEPPSPARRPGAATTGAALVLVALLYPLLALALGRPLAESEWFGLMPDPTALATLGLLQARGAADAPPRHPRAWLLLLPLPLLWCAIGGATLWTLKAPQWFVMPLAGLACAVLAGSARRGAGGAAPGP